MKTISNDKTADSSESIFGKYSDPVFLQRISFDPKLLKNYEIAEKKITYQLAFKTTDNKKFDILFGTIFQSILMQLLETKKVTAEYTIFPSSINEFVLNRHLTNNVKVIIKSIKDDTSSSDTFVYDIVIKNNEEETILTMNGLKLKTANPVKIKNEIVPFNYNQLYSMDWHKHDQTLPIKSEQGFTIIPNSKLAKLLLKRFKENTVEYLEINSLSEYRLDDSHQGSKLNYLIIGIPEIKHKAVSRKQMWQGFKTYFNEFLEFTKKYAAYKHKIVLIFSSDLNTKTNKNVSSNIYACLNSFIRTICSESKNLEFLNLYLDDISINEAYSQIITDIVHSHEKELLYHSAYKHVQRLNPIFSIAHDKKFDFNINSNKSYLITGGSGEIGTTLCQWLLMHDAGEVILIGRSPFLNADKIKKLKNYDSKKITYYQCDISVKKQTLELFSKINANHKHLSGIFHLAGSSDNRMFADHDWKSFYDVLKPKIQGSLNILDATKSKDADWLVQFSSISSFLPTPSQSAYSTANSFMDSLCYFNNNRKLKVFSINFGPWDATGMAKDLEIQDVKIMEEIGINLLSETMATFGLNFIPYTDSPQICISNFNQQAKDNTAISRYFEKVSNMQLLPFPGMATVIPSNNNNHVSNINKLSGVKEQNKQRVIKEYIFEILSKKLGYSKAKLNDNLSLQELGLDSLLAIELKNQIMDDFSINIPISKFLQNRSIQYLVNYINQKS